MPDSWKTGSESFGISGFNVRDILEQSSDSLSTVGIPVMTVHSCKVNIWLSVDMVMR